MPMKKPYTITLDFIHGEKFSASGASAMDALLELAPKKISGKCVLIAEKDGKKYERVLPPILVRRIVANNFYRIILSKWITSCLA